MHYAPSSSSVSLKRSARMFFLSSMQARGLSFAQRVTRVGKVQHHADMVCRYNTTSCKLHDYPGYVIVWNLWFQMTFCELSFDFGSEALSTHVLVTRISAVLAADISTSDVWSFTHGPKKRTTHISRLTDAQPPRTVSKQATPLHWFYGCSLTSRRRV